MNLEGQHINGYTIKQRIGAGGMGEVYLARHKEMGRNAAVKVLFDEGMVDRFRNEAYIQSKVNHPNIARLYEFSSLMGRPCIIMEYVTGKTLEKLVTTQPFLATHQIDLLFKQICNGVKALHEKGIQHRDLKPSNIKVMDNGTVKLLDFGIAKANYSPKLTKEGFVVGTTDFISPEQFEGENSISSDIWSLGVLLYFLLTKELPFDYKSIVEQRKNIQQGKYKSPSKINKAVTVPHLKIIATCLQVKPEKRPNIRQLLEMLDQPKASEQKRGFSLNTSKSFQNPIIVISTIALILVLFGWMSKSLVSDEPTVYTQKVAPVDTIEIIVQNTRNAKLQLPNKTVLQASPFVITKPQGQPFTFSLKEGKYETEITIPADFNKNRFMCNMNY